MAEPLPDGGSSEAADLGPEDQRIEEEGITDDDGCKE